MSQTKRRAIFACLLAVCGTTTAVFFAAAQWSSHNISPLEQRIRRIEGDLRPTYYLHGQNIRAKSIHDRMHELQVPGLSIAVARNGQLEWARGYGSTDSSGGHAVDTNTLFLAGSISKPLTAIRVLQLADEGKLDLDRDVNYELKSWKVPENEFTQRNKVTARRLLNHTAAMTGWGFPGYSDRNAVPTAIDVLNGNAATPAVRVFQEPGKSWCYSGGGYTVLQVLLSDIDADTFPELMRIHVLDRLGMRNSTFENPLPSKLCAVAAAAHDANGKKSRVGKWPVYPEMAAAGLWSTPSDLLRYAIEMQRIKKSGADGIVSFRTLTEMLTPGLNGHGLGPIIKEHTYGHDGSDTGFRASLVVWKEIDFAVAVMTNSDDRRIIDEVIQSVAAEYGLPGFIPSVKKIQILPADELEKFAGIYELAGVGSIRVSPDTNGLRLELQFGGRDVWKLVPESRTEFFQKGTGLSIRFELDGVQETFKISGRGLVFRKN